MIKSYPEAVAYLYENLPMFQRVGATALKHDLTNTIKLCETLGNPERKFKSIHVAGTNGKGSTSHMLASILQSAGLKTGLYTSPHLKEFTERIRVNGIPVPKDFVVDFVNRIQPAIESIKPSFFEITVAMAFDFFVQQQVDIAVIEVGLGGRLDSTNVITPLVSVITNISWDHKDILGDTLQKIAFEKAGIIKRDVPVVISQRQAEVESVFISRANELHAAITFASDQYHAVWNNSSMKIYRKGDVFIDDLRLPLLGSYQAKNVSGVMATVEALNNLGITLGKNEVVKGLEQVTHQTGLKGRWQILRNKPMVVCDTGHNEDGVKQVMDQIAELPFKRLHMVWGMVKDKDISNILRLLPKQASYYFCQAKIPRAMDATALAEKAAEFGLKGTIIADVNEAKKAALKQAAHDDLIFIGGSTFVVAEIDEL